MHLYFLKYFFCHPHVTDNGEAVGESSATTQAISYIPYGEVFVEQQAGGWSSPYLFNAKELDSETGLYYYGARHLDPSDAMWLSVDPLWEKYVGMTPYGYCAGNPVRLVDVDGRAVYGKQYEDGMSYVIGEKENITAAGYEGYEWIDDSYDCMDENGNYKTLPSANSTTTMSSTSQSQPTSQKDQNYGVVCSYTKQIMNMAATLTDYTTTGIGGTSAFLEKGGSIGSNGKFYGPGTGAILNTSNSKYRDVQGWGGNKYVKTTQLTSYIPKVSKIGNVGFSVVSAYNIGCAMAKDGGIGANTARETVKAGFSYAGALCGSKAGAYVGGKVGLAIGSFFCGAGAVPGAAIGTFVGSVGGAIGGGILGAEGIDAFFDNVLQKK